MNCPLLCSKTPQLPKDRFKDTIVKYESVHTGQTRMSPAHKIRVV